MLFIEVRVLDLGFSLCLVFIDVGFVNGFVFTSLFAIRFHGDERERDPTKREREVCAEWRSRREKGKTARCLTAARW